MVGVKGVAHTEGVGQYTGAKPEEPCLGDVVVVPGRRRQHPPAQDVETGNDENHAADPQPFLGGETVAKSLANREGGIVWYVAAWVTSPPGSHRRLGHVRLRWIGSRHGTH